jgi:hypothetical protein
MFKKSKRLANTVANMWEALAATSLKPEIRLLTALLIDEQTALFIL